MRSEEVLIVHEGTVSASSEYPGFPAKLAADFDLTTSWYSAGPEPDGSPTIFRWTGKQEDLIILLVTHNNIMSIDESESGYGFESVTVQILDASDNIVYEESVPLPGTSDPSVILEPNVVGQSVVFYFFGHDDPERGGFSELIVQVLR